MKCDFHIHSYASYDSISSPKDIIKEASKKGIDCIAITDHGEVKAFEEIKKHALSKGILVIRGIELKSDKGDIIGLNIKEKIPEGLSVKETIRRIKNQNGFVFIPHPFFSHYRFKEDLNNILEDIDAVEVLNASISKGANKKALDFVEKNNLPFTAGSDAHSSCFVGRSYLEIPGNQLSVEEVLMAIKNKKGKIKGKEISFLEIIKDRIIRNFAKIIDILT